MLLLRYNPKGGPKLKPNNFPIHSDSQGNLGLLIGYDKDGEKLLLPISLAEQVANVFASRVFGFKNKIKSINPYIPWRERLALWLLKGKREVREMKESIEMGEWD